jgi:hypothetical protein
MVFSTGVSGGVLNQPLSERPKMSGRDGSDPVFQMLLRKPLITYLFNNCVPFSPHSPYSRETIQIISSYQSHEDCLTIIEHNKRHFPTSSDCPPKETGFLSTIRMKVFSNDCTFDYSWGEVSTGNWVKYCPWNDKSTHVIAVDTLSREVDSKTGIVRHP